MALMSGQQVADVVHPRLFWLWSLRASAVLKEVVQELPAQLLREKAVVQAAVPGKKGDLVGDGAGIEILPVRLHAGHFLCSFIRSPFLRQTARAVCASGRVGLLSRLAG